MKKIFKDIFIFIFVVILSYLAFSFSLMYENEEAQSNIIGSIITLLAALIASLTVFINYTLQKDDRFIQEKYLTYRRCLSSALMIKADISALISRVNDAKWIDYFKDCSKNFPHTQSAAKSKLEIPLIKQDYFIVFHTVISQFDEMHLYLLEAKSKSEVTVDELVKWYVTSKGLVDTFDSLLELELEDKEKSFYYNFLIEETQKWLNEGAALIQKLGKLVCELELELKKT